MEFLSEFMMPVVLGICLAVGYVIKKWIKDVDVLYIGKSKKTVKERMLEHIEFYNWDKNNKGDNNIRARGGRSIGQINNYDDLEVWYLQLVSHFFDLYLLEI